MDIMIVKVQPNKVKSSSPLKINDVIKNEY